MKKFKPILFAAVVAAAAVFTGCTEEMITDMSSIQLSFEDFNGGGDKAYISGNYACWENGDQIKLSKSTNNGSSYSSYTGSIAISYPSGAAVASASAAGFSTEAGNWVFCGYPSASFGGEDGHISKNETSVTLYSSYNYSESNGKQLITCPMVGGMQVVGYTEGDPNPNVLKMYNLCCMLKIKLDKPENGAFTVDSIVVINQSHMSGSAMSGSGEVTYTETTGSDGITRYVPTLAMTGSTDDGTRDRVVLNLASNPVAINATKYFYVPIPPQAANQDFKILIRNQITGHWSYTTIHSEKAIPGNCIATIQGPTTEDVTPYVFYDYLVNNNGSSYIDLGLKPSNTSKMEMTFMLRSGMDITKTMYLSGSRKAANDVFYFSFTGPSDKTYFSSSFMSSGPYPTNACSTNGSGIVRQTNQKYRFTTEVKEGTTGYYYTDVTFEQLDNATGATTAQITGTTNEVEGGIPGNCNSNILLYATHTSNKIIAGLKVYSYRVWDNGVLEHNFVPAKRTQDGHYGMYDMSTGEFVDGATHGSFTAGND